MKSVHVLAVMMAAIVPCVASAADLSHNHVEVGVARLHDEIPASLGRDAKFDGGYLRGSAALGDSGLYGFGSYRRGSSDTPFNGLDAARSQLGVGYAHRVTPGLELLGEAGYLRDEIEGYGFDTGRVSAGVRGMLGERVEGWAKAHYTDDTFDSSRYSGELGGLVRINPTWGVTGGVELGADRKEYTLGLRASF